MIDEMLSNETRRCKLLLAVVQAQDVDGALGVLEKEAIQVTRLPSVGGFLGRRNATLLISVSTDACQKAIDLLEQTCRKRVTFIAVPIENAPLPMPMPIPVTIGGASIFTLAIEHAEEI